MRRLGRIPDWAWVALALALRLGFALKLGSRFYQVDESAFDAAAWGLAARHILGADAPQIIAPVPVSFFGLFYLLGHDPLYPRLAQACLGAGFVYLLGRLTRQLSGSRLAGSIAMALSAIYPFTIYYGGMLMSETLYVATVVPGLCWLALSLKEGKLTSWRAPAAGLALSLAALSRMEAMPIAGLLWVLTALLCLAGRWSWKSWGLAVLCWILPLAFWGLRNQKVTGRFTLDNHGGITLLHGTVLYDRAEELDTLDAMKHAATLPWYQEALKLPEAERDAVYVGQALKFMRENPGQTFLQWCNKLVAFWRFYPRLNKTYFASDRSQPNVGLGRKMMAAISLLFEPALILLGFAGLWHLRRLGWALLPFWVFLASSTAIHMLIVSMMRYRLACMPLLILSASALLAWTQGPAAQEP
ncbi:MAG: hypothetical protein AAB320_04370 [Elusimicrobiota bacterium]